MIAEKPKFRICRFGEIACPDSNGNEADAGNAADLPKQERSGLRANEGIIADLPGYRPANKLAVQQPNT